MIEESQILNSDFNHNIIHNGLLHINHPLVARPNPRLFNVIEFILIFSIADDINILDDFAHGWVFDYFLPSVASVEPLGLVRKLFTNLLCERYDFSPIVFEHWVSTRIGDTRTPIFGQVLENLFLCGIVKLDSAIRIPRIVILTIETMMGTSRNPEDNSVSISVNLVAMCNRKVVHIAII